MALDSALSTCSLSRSSSSGSSPVSTASSSPLNLSEYDLSQKDDMAEPPQEPITPQADPDEPSRDLTVTEELRRLRLDPQIEQRLLQRLREKDLLVESANRRAAESKLEIEGARRRSAEAKLKLESANSELASANRRNEALMNQMRDTTLPEYLALCHESYTMKFDIETDTTQTTTGKPENAEGKCRPDKIARWESFASEYGEIWQEISESGFLEERLFMSQHSLRETGRTYRRKIGSELDLHPYQRYAVEIPVAHALNEYFKYKQSKGESDVIKTVTFENHANTLTASELLYKTDAATRSAELEGPSPSLDQAEVKTELKKRLHSSRADQFCVSTIVAGDQTTKSSAFVMEFKAPHKVSLAQVNMGLGANEDINVEAVLRVGPDAAELDKARHLTAALITQAFSYMVQQGTKYGCVCTGQLCIFLKVDEDPRTVYYYLSVPQGDVGDDLSLDSGNNGLHLTAVGQMLAFTMQALRTRPHSPDWINTWSTRLEVWKVSYDEARRKVDFKRDSGDNDYKPPRNRKYLDMSPIQKRKIELRPRKPRVYSDPDIGPTLSPRRDDSSSGGSGNGNIDDSFQPPTPTPSQPNKAKGKQAAQSRGQQRERSNTQSDGGRRRQDVEPTSGKLLPLDWLPERNENPYCTQECLRTLSLGLPLDASCPNASRHSSTPRHALTTATFLAQMHAQLTASLSPAYLQDLHITGSRGALFKATLLPHGYTVVAKCTTARLAPHLRHESALYGGPLAPLQGAHVPVHLGALDLPPARAIPYRGAARLSHLVLLAHAGAPLARAGAPAAEVERAAAASLRAVHARGVLHCDAEARNLLWLGGRVMVVDFERSRVVGAPLPAVSTATATASRRKRRSRGGRKAGKKRAALAEVTGNEARASAEEVGAAQGAKEAGQGEKADGDCFEEELERMVRDVKWCCPRPAAAA